MLYMYVFYVCMYIFISLFMYVDVIYICMLFINLCMYVCYNGIIYMH